MNFANLKQNFQDWITQQWVILFGSKIDLEYHSWLLGPFGKSNSIGFKLIEHIAQQENLEIVRNDKVKGLVSSFQLFNIPEKDISRLSRNISDFYENTSNYNLDFSVNWNPFFKPFGYLLKIIFSNRLQQLNIPLNNSKDSKDLKSEIIHLIDKTTKEVKRTIWLRTLKKSNQVVFSGIYEVCSLPNKSKCIKAIFPLPNGNATVILKPKVGDNGELILQSFGKTIGETGFYFLLKDSKGKLWAKFLSSFKDKLTIFSFDGKLSAKQRMTLWGLKVVEFHYKIYKKNLQT